MIFRYAPKSHHVSFPGITPVVIFGTLTANGIYTKYNVFILYAHK